MISFWRFGRQCVKIFGDFWRFLAIFGDFWRFLAIWSTICKKCGFLEKQFYDNFL
jgi:hypothetical protein